MAKAPAAAVDFDGSEPGYTVNIYNQFTNYTVPGPAVWAVQNG
jgi:hypothetical protein